MIGNPAKKDEIVDPAGHANKEEGDVTEIYFIISGDWGVGYNSFQGNISRFNYNAEFDLPGTEDLEEKGIMIA